MEKTILEWFDKLPEPIRSLAINNFAHRSEHFQRTKAGSVVYAISLGFDWLKSSEGYNYWSEIHSRAKAGEFDKPKPTKPTHYDFAIQPIEYIEANGLGFCEGNIIKYVTRYKLKGGLEDLKKAQCYLQMLIDKNTTNQ